MMDDKVSGSISMLLEVEMKHLVEAANQKDRLYGR